MLRKSTNWGVKCRTSARTLEGSFGKWTIPTFGNSAATPATPLQNLLCLPASQKIEETLWTSLRTFEERKNLLNIMAATSPKKGKSRIAQRARETHIPIERIKAMIQASQQKSGRSTLAHVDELMAQPAMAASAQANRDSHFAMGPWQPPFVAACGSIRQQFLFHGRSGIPLRAGPCLFPDTSHTGHSGYHKTASAKTVLSKLQFGGDCHRSTFGICLSGRLSKIEQLWINSAAKLTDDDGKLLVQDSHQRLQSVSSA